MEFITILFSSLLAAISPAGLIVDHVIAKTIRSQVKSVEQLEVRIDNAPSYQILQGKVERVRIASRGIQPIANLRIEVLELETDPIDIDLHQLQERKNKEERRGEIRENLSNFIVNKGLRKPLQGAVRIVVTEADINHALQSTEIKSYLQKLVNRLIPKQDDEQTERYQLSNPQIDLLANNRLRFQVQLRPGSSQQETSDQLEIMLEVGLNVVAGRSLQLVEPTGTLNRRKLSTRLLKSFAQGLDSQLDLRKLEKKGITARLLQLSLEQDQITLAGFLKVIGEGRRQEAEGNRQ